MNIQISSYEEIQKAIAEGEYAILALFDKFEAQVKVLAEQIEIQAAAKKTYRQPARKGQIINLKNSMRHFDKLHQKVCLSFNKIFWFFLALIFFLETIFLLKSTL